MAPTITSFQKIVQERVFIPKLEDYGVSSTSGFLPEIAPLDRLTNPYYEPWERIVDNLQGLLLTGKLRDWITKLPLLSADKLSTEREFQRAFLVLALLTHSYIWGKHQSTDPTIRILPSNLAIPFTQVAIRLGLRPIVCYAAVDLWNWKVLDEEGPVDLSNIMTLNTYTGTMDEAHFYLVPIAIESAGAEALPMMMESLKLILDGSNQLLQLTSPSMSMSDRLKQYESSTLPSILGSLATNLSRLNDIVNTITNILHTMNLKCDPYVFYNQMRPYVAGWSLIENGVEYEGVDINKIPASWDPKPSTTDPSRPVFSFAGGSAAQSSLIQSFDIFLGVEHFPTGMGPSSSPAVSRRPPPPSASSVTSSPPPKSSAAKPVNFIAEMRNYMPQSHRQFLVDLELKSPCLRSFTVELSNFFNSFSSSPDKTNSLSLISTLLQIYNTTLHSLRIFRDKHIQIVTRYIIIQSKRSSLATMGNIPSTNPTSTSTSTSPTVSRRVRTISSTSSGSVTENGHVTGFRVRTVSSTSTEDLADGNDTKTRNSYFGEVIDAHKPAGGYQDTSVATQSVQMSDVSVSSLNISNDVQSESTKPRPRTSSDAKEPQKYATSQLNSSITEGIDSVRGTGGTQLIPFLKQARDETRDARV